MQATTFEYRFRFWIHALIYLLGFAGVPLINTLADRYLAAGSAALGLTDKSTWLVLTTLIARAELLNFTAATMVILVLAILLTGLGAWFRVWGTAYVGAGIVQSQAMHAAGDHGRGMIADGPYRHTRNPLYLGTVLHTIGIALLMPPAGAVFTVGLLWVFQVRLALAEEPFLAARFGQAYLNYKAAVPRFLPSLTALVPAAGDRPHWLVAICGEFYMVGVFITLLGFGWSFNSVPLIRGILISLGVSLVLRAFLPRPMQEAETA